MAKNKRKALSAIQNNVIASPRKKNKTGVRKRTAASPAVPSRNGSSKTDKAVPIARPKRISSKARASDVFEGNKHRVQYVSPSTFCVCAVSLRLI
jgi:hypothetical protein